MNHTKTLLLLLMLLGCTTQPVITPVDLSRPSIANTSQVIFLSKVFDLRVKNTRQAVPLYEFFLASDDTDTWTELVDFRVLPFNPDGNEPKDHAARIAKLFIQQYPYMRFALYVDKQNGAAVLDFFYPMSTRKDGSFFEFNAFKFFKDAGSANVLLFHYAKNVPGITDERPLKEVTSEIKDLRAEVLPALAAFPLYRQ